MVWGRKALVFLLDLLLTLSGLGSGLEPKQILLPAVQFVLLGKMGV